MSYPFKRFLDFLGALVGLVLLSPIIAAVALVILLTEGAPVLFRQQRIGRNGEPFTIYKFRTMRHDAPEVPTEELGSYVDLITPLGAWLRRTSLDELPQLWNVLVGDMSLVGPRPSLPSQYDLNAGRVELGVVALRPGLTGWAQVNGRDAIDNATKLDLDAAYAERQSLLFDLYVLWRTFDSLRSQRGAF